MDPDAITGGRRRVPEETAVRPDGETDRRDQGYARQRDPALFREDITRFHHTLKEAYRALELAFEQRGKRAEGKDMLPAQIETEKSKEKKMLQDILKIFHEADTEIQMLYRPFLEYIKRHTDENKKTKDESFKNKAFEKHWEWRGRVAMALLKQTSLALGFLAGLINEEDQEEEFLQRYKELIEEHKEELDQIPFSTATYVSLSGVMRRASDFDSFNQMTKLSFDIVQEYIDFTEPFMKKYADAFNNPLPTSLTS